MQMMLATVAISMYNHSMMNTTTYKTIPAQFHKKGFQYNQLKRDGMKAIFQQTKQGSIMNNYEVVKLGRHNGYTMGGMMIEPAETYPGSSLWGIAGWTCSSIDAAMIRYDALNS